MGGVPVQVLLEIDERCRLVRCAVSEPTGSERLDQAVCVIFRTTGRFNAAISGGKPVRSEFYQRLQLMGAHEPVELVPDSMNKHDGNAIAVMSPSASSQAISTQSARRMSADDEPRRGRDGHLPGHRWRIAPAHWHAIRSAVRFRFIVKDMEYAFDAEHGDKGTGSQGSAG